MSENADLWVINENAFTIEHIKGCLLWAQYYGDRPDYAESNDIIAINSESASELAVSPYKFAARIRVLDGRAFYGIVMAEPYNQELVGIGVWTGKQMAYANPWTAKADESWLLEAINKDTTPETQSVYPIEYSFDVPQFKCTQMFAHNHYSGIFPGSKLHFFK